jgi:serine/threonine protein kinase
VYAARDAQTGADVAIKWMHAHPFSPDDPDLLRFIQEARIAGTLDSPHVARTIELERDPETGVPFQVMELLDGEDLSSLLKRTGALRPDVALRIAAQACAGLAAAHTAGVVHRDIKPENLYLARRSDGSLVVKLLDFGVAKIRRTMSAGASRALTAPMESITKTGEVVGTPLFMAPEQLDDMKHVDRRSDVYSMGVTMYALCAGAPPHANIQSFIQLIHTIVNVPAPSLSEVASWTPPKMIAVIEKAMARDPRDRYPDATALLNALEPLVHDDTDLRPEMVIGVDDTVRKKEIVSVGASSDREAGTPLARTIATNALKQTASSWPKRIATIAIVGVVITLVVVLVGR